MIRDRQLFGPGPSNPYPEATAALGLPLLGHLDPAFIELMDETCDMLRQAWGTTNARTLPISATGSAGMEAAFVNTVHPGDVVVVAVNGLFGQRMCDVAARCGAEVVPVEHEWGRTIDVQRVLDAHPSTRMAWMPRRNDLIQYLANELRDGDVCISMGCGDIASLPDEVQQRRARLRVPSSR